MGPEMFLDHVLFSSRIFFGGGLGERVPGTLGGISFPSPLWICFFFFCFLTLALFSEELPSLFHGKGLYFGEDFFLFFLIRKP